MELCPKSSSTNHDRAWSLTHSTSTCILHSCLGPQTLWALLPRRWFCHWCGDACFAPWVQLVNYLLVDEDQANYYITAMTGYSISIKCKQKQELDELSSCVSLCVWFIKANKSLSIDVYSRFNISCFVDICVLKPSCSSFIHTSVLPKILQVMFFSDVCFSPMESHRKTRKKLAWRNVAFISSALEFLWDRHWISEDPSGQKATLSSQNKNIVKLWNNKYSGMEPILSWMTFCVWQGHLSLEPMVCSLHLRFLLSHVFGTFTTILWFLGQIGSLSNLKGWKFSTCLFQNTAVCIL